nr:MAK10-like protein [Tanacetum cinerariifolium]
DENPIRILGDYCKPSHVGYRNTIELLVGNNMVRLRSDTIPLVQNGCSFHGLEKEEKSDKCDVATDDGSKKTDGPNMEVSVKETKTKNGAENRTKNKPIKKAKKEEAVEAPSSQPVEYYLKHRINEKLIEGLVDNNTFNDSLSGV